MPASESSDEDWRGTSPRSARSGAHHPCKVPSLNNISKRGSSGWRPTSVQSSVSDVSAGNRIDLRAVTPQTLISNHQQGSELDSGSSSGEDSDEDATPRLTNAWDPSPPSLASEQVLALWAMIWPLGALVMGSTVLIVLEGATGHESLWFSIGHAVLALLVVAWMLALGAMREQALLVCLAEEVGRVVTADPSDVPKCLSHDSRVYYVQAQVHGTTIRAAVAKEEARLRASDPMHFIRDDMKKWDVSETGYTVIDTTGVILYANPTMSQRLGHPKDALLGANVRILMPQPYSKQHDFFLKKYLDTGLRNVIGMERAVPVLKADGTQAIVHLGVEEVDDPFGKQGRLFVGVCGRTVGALRGPSTGRALFRGGGAPRRHQGAYPLPPCAEETP